MTERGPPSYRHAEEYRRLSPGISGNTVNGLGEANRRRPTPVFWHDPGRIAHGPLQQWIVGRFNETPELKDFHLRFGGRGRRELSPIASERQTDRPESWSERVKAVALANEAELVGIARLDPEWVFEGYVVAEPWIVMLGIAMDHDRLATAPEIDAQVEVMTQYNRGTRAARAVANWIRERGWSARPHGGPRAGPVNMIPAALASGFGELGKHGSIINRTLGSSFRLAAVLTDLPLVADAREAFGADDFCARCRVCAAACPPQAIFEAKQLVRGETKWYVDFEKCLPYFNETYGCAICVAVCPWSRPGVAPRLADKLMRRAAHKDSAKDPEYHRTFGISRRRDR